MSVYALSLPGALLVRQPGQLVRVALPCGAGHHCYVPFGVAAPGEAPQEVRALCVVCTPPPPVTRPGG